MNATMLYSCGGCQGKNGPCGYQTIQTRAIPIGGANERLSPRRIISRAAPGPKAPPLCCHPADVALGIQNRVRRKLLSSPSKTAPFLPITEGKVVQEGGVGIQVAV